MSSHAAVTALIGEYKTQKLKNRAVTLATVSSAMCKDAMKRLKSTSQAQGGAEFSDLPGNVVRKIVNNNSLQRKNVRSLARAVPATVRWDARPRGVRLSKIALDNHKDVFGVNFAPVEWKELGDYDMFMELILYYKLFWRMMDPQFNCKAIKTLLQKDPIDLTMQEYRTTVVHHQAVATLKAMMRGSFPENRTATNHGNMYKYFPGNSQINQGAKHFSLHIVDVAYGHCDKDVRNLARGALLSLLKLYTTRADFGKIEWWSTFTHVEYAEDVELEVYQKHKNILITMGKHPLFDEDADEELNQALQKCKVAVAEISNQVTAVFNVLQNAGAKKKRSTKGQKKK